MIEESPNVPAKDQRVNPWWNSRVGIEATLVGDTTVKTPQQQKRKKQRDNKSKKQKAKQGSD
jgi:hypothetical protein